ncbi:MAG: histone deacetylase family protein [Gammaproteobacteria bacterium]|nr:MAG: histone deacetylase family protein [Gammaproteobacteria bacterium]
MGAEGLLLGHPACARHENGPGHPERPQRLEAVRRGLAAAGLLERLAQEEAPRAPRAWLEAVHEPAYLDRLEALAPAGEGTVWLDPDTALGPHSLEAAHRAAGAAGRAVEAVLGGEAPFAFCAVRPPGHHAERGAAMGFCLLNNVAVGAARALALGAARVAVVDFDVHHGNGTEDVFAEEPRVLLVSSFQHPWYPGRGGRRTDHLLPLPLPAGTDGRGFRTAWAREGLPALRAFDPQVVLCSAGFDAHRLDPLGGLLLEAADYRWLAEALVGALPGRRAWVAVLEGGYHLEALAASAAAFVGGMLAALRAGRRDG